MTGELWGKCCYFARNGVKVRARKAGVPYTSYICAVLERAMAKPLNRLDAKRNIKIHKVI
jgi:hypothetical protein